MAAQNVTLVTAVGRNEPKPWQRDLAESITELVERRRQSKLRWVRILDGRQSQIDAMTLGSAPENLESVVLPPLRDERIGIGPTRNRSLPAWLELPRRLDLLEEYAADQEWLAQVGSPEH